MQLGLFIVFKTHDIYLFEGNINTDIFLEWTAGRLIPSLPERSVIVMANAAFHQKADRLKAIWTKGHSVSFLPPYSPVLNPIDIEKKWEQAKNIRKKQRCNPYHFQTFLV